MKSNLHEILCAILLSVLIVACTTTKGQVITKNPGTMEQVFISGQNSGLPGKCYSKFKKDTDVIWTERICENQISKNLISQVQSDLQRMNYTIDANEIAEYIIGSTTKQAIRDYQMKNSMAYGGLDWATVNRLKSE